MNVIRKKKWQGLKKIFEFIWPYYDSYTKEQLRNMKNREKSYSKDNLEEEFKYVKDDKTIDFILEQAEKLFDDEDKRVENIERKCSIITGFSGLAIMLSFGFVETLFKETSMNTVNLIFLFLMFFIVNIYLIAALINAVGGLKKRDYFRVNETNFIVIAKSTSPKIKLAALYIENRVKNFRVINRKVDRMHLATQFFKRALIAAFLIAVCIFSFNIYSTYSSKLNSESKKSDCSVIIKTNISH